MGAAQPMTLAASPPLETSGRTAAEYRDASEAGLGGRAGCYRSSGSAVKRDSLLVVERRLMGASRRRRRRSERSSTTVRAHGHF
jgi:hypothetical protein